MSYCKQQGVGRGVRRLARAFLAVIGLTIASVALAQGTFPERRVTIIVGFPAGGTTDITARIYAEKLQARWGQPVIVDNRPGAASAVANNFVRRQPPDGYTLYIVSSPLTIAPYVNPSAHSYNPVKDFTPIAQLCEIVSVATATSSAPFNNIKEFVEFAKSNPGKLNIGTSGLGSSDHLSQARMAKMAGIELNFVHFKGDAPATQAVAAGTIDFRLGPYLTAKPLLEAGRLKVLGAATMKRSPLVPMFSPMSETIPGFAHVPYNAIVGPAGMPPDLVQRLNQDLNAISQMPDVVARLNSLGLDAVTKSTQEFTDYLLDAMKASIAAVEASGIKPE